MTHFPIPDPVNVIEYANVVAVGYVTPVEVQVVPLFSDTSIVDPETFVPGIEQVCA